MVFDYFYGNEAEQFTFYRIPKVLVTSPQFKNVSDSAKILYGLMLDRMGLSIMNGWLDEQGRAYIFFTLDDIEEEMACSIGKAVKLLAELDTKKGIGLIERIKQGQGKPTIIYLKKFVGVDNSQKYSRVINDKNQELQKSKSKTSKNCKSRLANNKSADLQKVECNNIEINDTELSNIYPSNQDERNSEKMTAIKNESKRWIDRYNKTVVEIKEQLDYDSLINTNDREIVDEVVNIMADVMTVYRPKYKIEGIPIECDAVINNFKKVTADKLEVCLIAYSRVRKKVGNTKAYWITVLYNIPLTSHLALSNMVNNDMYGGGE